MPNRQSRGTRLLQLILRNCELINPRDRLVRVKSWIPRFNEKWQMEWPVMLVDCVSYRAGVVPIWDKVRWYRLLVWASPAD
jgi:hypothetical protein